MDGKIVLFMDKANRRDEENVRTEPRIRILMGKQIKRNYNFNIYCISVIVNEAQSPQWPSATRTKRMKCLSSAPPLFSGHCDNYCCPLTCKLYTALSYSTWNVRNNDMSITVKNTAANLGRDTPTTKTQSLCDESGPGGLIAVFGNHLYH